MANALANNDERREYSRYLLRAFAELGGSTKKWDAHILDISAEGMRVALLDEYDLYKGETVHIKIELPNTKTQDGTPVYVHLNGIIAHQQEHILGVFYQPETEHDAELLHALLTDFD
jgi:exoribonuclease II